MSASEKEPGDFLMKLTPTIDTKDAFIELVCKLTDVLDEHPETCTNWDLRAYLLSLAQWLSSAHNYYCNFDLDVSTEVPSWRLFADCLLAARIYDDDW